MKSKRGIAIPEENDEIEYACPVCGAGVSGDALECFNCGEQFAQNGDVNGNGFANGENGVSQIEEQLSSIEEEGGELPPDEEFEEGEFEEEITVEETSEIEHLPVEDDEISEEEITVEETSEIEHLPVEDEEIPEEELLGDDDLAVPDFDEDEYPDEEPYFEEEPEQLACKGCGALAEPDSMVCKECGESLADLEESTEGCPSCGSTEFTPQKGDMVSCNECGNVYLHEIKMEGPDNSWKWKFWLGLIFIVVGDFGFALVSYLHNVARWSPLGDMYLGYGWLDSLLGVVGVIIFIIGLILFAWSFKREREVDCPSCGHHLRESDLLPVEDEEEEEDFRIQDVIGEIEEVAECPSCGAPTTIFDESCSECGVIFETDEFEEEILEEDVVEEEIVEEVVTEEVEEAEPGEFDEQQLIMESMEVLDGEPEPEPELSTESELNGDSMEVLEELESKLTLNGMDDESLDIETDAFECPECGSIIGAGAKECPVCGTYLDEGGE